MARNKYVIPIETDTSDAKRDIRSLGKDVDNTSDSFGGMAKSVNVATIAAGTAAVAFAALGTAAVISVKAFAEFENEMMGVRTLLDQTSFGAKGLEGGADKRREGIAIGD